MMSGLLARRLARCVALAATMLTGLGACASRPSADAPVPISSSASSATAAPGTVTLPPAAARFSYQIGGAYPPPAGTGIVDRDASDPAVPGVYSICYLNAFQAQTADVAWWTKHHDQLLLRGADQQLIIDPDWDEPLFDISTVADRTALIGVEGAWIDQCAAAGYRAVEPDNLDSYTRSHGLLTSTDALAFAALLAGRAHQDGLAIAQKNAADLAVAAHQAGLDFAIAEECQVYEECGSYTDVYGAHVIEIEYTDQPGADFATACRLRGSSISVVLRDRDVVPAGSSGHVERWCS